jgi:hypothetical protein
MATAVAGLTLGALGLVAPVSKLILWWKKTIHDVRSFDEGYRESDLKFNQLSDRFDSTMAVLFDEHKFSFLHGNLFDKLPEGRRSRIMELFEEISRALYDHYTLSSTYKGWIRDPPSRELLFQNSPITAEEMRLIFDSTPTSPFPTEKSSIFRRKALQWSMSGKGQAEKLNNRFDDWLKRVRDEIEDSWWPLSFFENSAHLAAVEADRDAQTMGVAEHAGLRKLIVDDASLLPELELKNTEVLPGQVFDEGNRELSRFAGKPVLVEYLQFQPVDGFLPQTLKRRFAETSTLLHLQKDPDFRALHCLGYVNREVSTFRVDLVFEMPASTDTATSLLRLINSERSFKPSLGLRFKLCHILAQSISLFHSVNWIHRGFRSENILYFMRKDSTDAVLLDDPKICGFDVCRLENDFSTGPYDDIMCQNVYRHPDRWGTPKKTFTKYHDIYCELFLQFYGRRSLMGKKLTRSSWNCAYGNRALGESRNHGGQQFRSYSRSTPCCQDPIATTSHPTTRSPVW